MADLIKLRSTLNAILNEEVRGAVRYPSDTLRRRFTSNLMPITFQDVIIAHNDAEDFDMFVHLLADVAETHVEEDDANKWADRVRQAIVKHLSRSDDTDAMTGALGVDMAEIERFMKQPKRPVWHRPNQRP